MTSSTHVHRPDQRDGVHENRTVVTSSGAHVFRAIDRFYGSRGWQRRSAEGLVVPYFTSEFNRCVDHLHLNRLVTGVDDPASTTPWYQISLACRLNDLRKVEFGQHGSVFEMLTTVQTYPRDAAVEAKRVLARDVLTFLVEHIGLTRSAIGVTYFDGGEVLPGVVLAPDIEWREIWKEEGVSPSSIVPVRGPKNYLMFVGPGERCGPRCEILYRRPGTDRWMEVGTLILDSGVLRSCAPSLYTVAPPAVLVSGAAYGIERLIAACQGASSLAETPLIRSLRDTAVRYSRQPEEALGFAEGDLLILVDQVRACMFLLAEDVEPSTPQGRAILLMLRRIRRKLALLCIEEPDELLVELEKMLLERYAERYPYLRAKCGRLLGAVRDVSWPDGWSPESYQNLDVHAD